MKIGKLKKLPLVEGMLQCEIDYNGRVYRLIIGVIAKCGEKCKKWLKEYSNPAQLEVKFIEYDVLGDFPLNEIYRITFDTEDVQMLSIYLWVKLEIDLDKIIDNIWQDIKERGINEIEAIIYEMRSKIVDAVRTEFEQDGEIQQETTILIYVNEKAYKIPIKKESSKFQLKLKVISEEEAISLVKKVLERNFTWHEYPLPDFNQFTSYDPYSEELPVPKYDVMYLNPHFQKLISKKEA
jgi:hypothetical protein